MAIEYRKLSVNELDVFIAMRIDQLREEGAISCNMRRKDIVYFNRLLWKFRGRIGLKFW